MRSWLLAILGLLLTVAVAALFVFQPRLFQMVQGVDSSTVAIQMTSPTESSSPTPQASVSPTPAGSPSPVAVVPPSLEENLVTDANGLSKATVVMNTTQGVIKYKFYSKEAPKTVHRIIELVNRGFYNGLTFHRVVPGFVIQGGDPSGNGTGGSGQKLDGEFSKTLRHVEGSVAMARAADPNSADSQFYISLGAHPHLDHNYTIFGMVVEGIDVARKIKVGDKMVTVTVQ